MTKPRKYLTQKPFSLDMTQDIAAQCDHYAPDWVGKNVVRKALIDAIYIPCKIRPKARPRMGKNGRVHSPKGNQLELLNLLAMESSLAHSIPPKTGLIIDRYYSTRYPLKPSNQKPLYT